MIHSGYVEEVRGQRSPSFSKSRSRRSVIVNGRHLSAAMSLTGIVLSTEGVTEGDSTLTVSPLRARFVLVRRKMWGEKE